jgi:hypothetical protein
MQSNCYTHLACLCITLLAHSSKSVLSCSKIVLSFLFSAFLFGKEVSGKMQARGMFFKSFIIKFSKLIFIINIRGYFKYGLYIVQDMGQ